MITNVSYAQLEILGTQSGQAGIRAFDKTSRMWLASLSWRWERHSSSRLGVVQNVTFKVSLEKHGGMFMLLGENYDKLCFLCTQVSDSPTSSSSSDMSKCFPIVAQKQVHSWYKPVSSLCRISTLIHSDLLPYHWRAREQASRSFWLPQKSSSCFLGNVTMHTSGHSTCEE